MNREMTMFRMLVWVFTFLTAFVAEAQSLDLDPPGHPDHWKARAVPEKQYPLAQKRWNVDFEFTNVSGRRNQLMTSNGSLMYRVTAFILNDAGKRAGQVKTRIFSSFGMHNRYTAADPGGVIWTECDIREWLVIEKPGWYEIHVDRMLNMRDADDNAVGLPVKNVVKAVPFKIEVVP